MSTDFVDEDLMDSRAVSSGRETPARERGARAATGVDEDIHPARPLSDLDLNRLALQRRDLDERVAGAVHEIEHLQRRQRELENQKARFENLSRKQTEYEQGKREMIELLDRGVIMLDKEEDRAARAAGLMAVTRDGFREALEDLRAIREDVWSQTEFDEELGRALGRVEEARTLYKRGMARISASDWWKGTRGAVPVAPAGDAAVGVSRPGGFRYWLIAGVALTIPLAVVAGLLFVAYLYLAGLIF